MKIAHKFKFILILALFNLPLSFYALYLYAPNFTDLAGGGGLTLKLSFILSLLEFHTFTSTFSYQISL